MGSALKKKKRKTRKEQKISNLFLSVLVHFVFPFAPPQFPLLSPPSLAQRRKRRRKLLKRKERNRRRTMGGKKNPAHAPIYQSGSIGLSPKDSDTQCNRSSQDGAGVQASIICRRVRKVRDARWYSFEVCCRLGCAAPKSALYCCRCAYYIMAQICLLVPCGNRTG